MPQNKGGWTSYLEGALKKIIEQGKIQRSLHYSASERLNWWDRWYGIPVMVLEGIVTGGIFAVVFNAASCEQNIAMWWTLAGISSVSFGLDIIYKQLHLKEKVLQHNLASKKWAKFCQKREVILQLERSKRPDATEFLMRANLKMMAIFDDADTPRISMRTVDHYKKTQKDRRLPLPDVGNMIQVVPINLDNATSSLAGVLDSTDSDLQREFKAALKAKKGSFHHV